MTTKTIAETSPAPQKRELSEALDRTLAKPHHNTRSAAATGIFLAQQAGVDRATMVTTTLALLMCCQRRHNTATTGVEVDYFPLALRSANVVRAVASYLWLHRHEFCLIRGGPVSSIVVTKRGTRFTYHPPSDGSGCVVVIGPEPLTKTVSRLQLKLLRNGEGDSRACCAFGVITESKIQGSGHKLPMYGSDKDYSFIWSDGDTWGADHWADLKEPRDCNAGEENDIRRDRDRRLGGIVPRKRHCQYQAGSHIDIQYRMPTPAGSASTKLREKHGCITWFFKGDDQKKYSHLGLQHSEPVYWCVVCYNGNIETVWEIVQTDHR